ncbi:hypothetical protein WA158_002922 [Blastocystis sp. Blastoise]
MSEIIEDVVIEAEKINSLYPLQETAYVIIFICYFVLFICVFPRKGQTIIERIVELIFTLLTKFFFKDITVNGKEKIPKKGPVILVCAPHANQFVDAMIVSSQMPRKVYFIGAASSFKIPVVGTFMKLMNSIIPLNRPDDFAIKIGEVHVNGREVVGTNTHFTEYNPEKAYLLLGKHKIAIEKVIDDTHILIAEDIPKTPSPAGEDELPKPKTPEELKEEEGIYVCKFVPHLDNHKMFNETYDKLLDNNCVAIFPEGGSHDRPDLLPLKVGVSLLSLGFKTLYPDQELTVIPVGMNYYHQYIFRKATVLVDIGDPIPYSQYLKGYTEGGEEKRDCVSSFLNDIREGLNNVTTTASDWEINKEVTAARRIYTNNKVKLTTEEKVKIQRHFIDGLKEYGEEEDVRQIRNDIERYRDYMELTGFSDKQIVEQGANPKAKVYIPSLLFALFMCFITGIPSLPGFLLSIPMYIIVPIYSSKKQKKALAKSYVKIEAKDVLATNKIISTVVIFIILLFLYPLLLLLVLSHSYSIRMTGMEYFSIVCMLPWILYLGVFMGERYLYYFNMCRVLVWRVGNSSKGQLLYERRQKIQNSLYTLVEKYGPQLYSNFNEKRILNKDGTPKIGRVKTILNMVDILKDQYI